MMKQLHLCDCGHIAKAEGYSTGYGVFEGKKLCFACCALEDIKALEHDDRWVGYFHNGVLSNWPGTLKLTPVYKFNYNKQYPRYDFWFTINGRRWHGFQAGNYNTVAHCKALK